MPKNLKIVTKRFVQVTKALILAFKQKFKGRKHPGKQQPLPAKVKEPEASNSNQAQHFKLLDKRPIILEEPAKKANGAIEQSTSQVAVLKRVNLIRLLKKMSPKIRALVGKIENKPKQRDTPQCKLAAEIVEKVLDQVLARRQQAARIKIDVVMLHSDEFFVEPKIHTQMAENEAKDLALDELFALSEILQQNKFWKENDSAKSEKLL